MTPQLFVVLVAAFLASTVEFVEALTIVLVVGVTVNWRSAFVGTAAAVGALVVLVSVFGSALVVFVPLEALRVVIGLLLVLFGLKWLKKAILRYAGLKAMHDEEAIYEEQLAEMRARGEQIEARVDPFGVATAFKSVLLEGLEVAFIVITFGAQANSALGGSGLATGPAGGSHLNDILVAALGAVGALVVVTLAGIVLRRPLQLVPENTLKFVVGVLLTSFGAFWGGEGVGVSWPGGDLFLLGLVAIWLAIAAVLILWLRRSAPRAQASPPPDIEHGPGEPIVQEVLE